jgi:hypothetical protein
MARSLGCIPAPVVRVPGVPEPPRSAALGDCSTPLRVGSAISAGPPVVDAPGAVVIAAPLDDVPEVLPVCAIAMDAVARTPKATIAIIFFMDVSLFFQQRPTIRGLRSSYPAARKTKVLY